MMPYGNPVVADEGARTETVELVPFGCTTLRLTWFTVCRRKGREEEISKQAIMVFVATYIFHDEVGRWCLPHSLFHSAFTSLLSLHDD